MPPDSLDHTYFFPILQCICNPSSLLLSENLINVQYTYPYKLVAVSTGSSTRPYGICLIPLFTIYDQTLRISSPLGNLKS